MPAAGRLGDKATAPADAHGCPACPHPVIGPAVGGSPNVFVNGRPVLRLGDPGVHAACCGPNQWKAAGASPSVYVNGKPVHRMGDKTEHCGSKGKLVEGSPNVILDELKARKGKQEKPKMDWVEFALFDEDQRPIANERYELTLADGTRLRGRTDTRGRLRHEGIPPGSCELRIAGVIYRRM